MELNSLLTQMIDRQASDLHLAVGVPPIFRNDGALAAATMPNLTPEDLDTLLQSALPESRPGRSAVRSRPFCDPAP